MSVGVSAVHEAKWYESSCVRKGVAAVAITTMVITIIAAVVLLRSYIPDPTAALTKILGTRTIVVILAASGAVMIAAFTALHLSSRHRYQEGEDTQCGFEEIDRDDEWVTQQLERTRDDLQADLNRIEAANQEIQARLDRLPDVFVTKDAFSTLVNEAFEEGDEAVAAAASTNAELDTEELSSNDEAFEEGGEAVAAAASTNAELDTEELYSNDEAFEEGDEAVAAAVSTNAELDTEELSSNDEAFEEGDEAVAAAVSTNAELDTEELSSNDDAPEEGDEAVAAAVSTNAELDTEELSSRAQNCNDDAMHIE